MYNNDIRQTIFNTICPFSVVLRKNLISILMWSSRQFSTFIKFI